MNAKKWYKSKTIWANVSAIVAGVGTLVVTGDSQALVVSGLGMINIILRLVTKQSVD